MVQGALIGPRSPVRRAQALIAACCSARPVFRLRPRAERNPVLRRHPLQALWGIANPASLALMSRRVGADEQGQLCDAVTKS